MKNTFLTLLVILFSVNLLIADVPKTISYQGILTNADGSPVVDGNYKLTFKFTANPANSSVLWEESHENVEVANGLFNVILGSINPIELPFDRKYYLGISINDGETLQPLTELTSVPYSLNVSDQAAVKSLNGLTGRIGLYAGDNISISTDADSAIIFSSSNGGGLTLPFNGSVDGAVPGFVVTSSGSGNAIVGRNTGTNRAATFEIDNSDNVGSAIFSSTNGTGRAGDFQVNNTSNVNAALFAASNGGNTSKTAQFQMSGNGTALMLNHLGTSGRFATFQADGADKVVIFRDGRGIYSGGLAGNSNQASFPGISGLNNGTGRAGSFTIDNSSSFASSVYGTTNGTGRAGDFVITNSSNNNFAVLGASNGTGSGGYFQMSGTGTGLTVTHIGSSGDIAVFQNSGSNVTRIDKTGKGFFNGGTQTGGADIAEAFDVEGSVFNYEPGDVLAISLNNDRTVELSKDPYSKLVAGVFATKPGVLLSERDIDSDHSDMVPMGVVGVLPTKVTSENGGIKRGDLLVTSSLPGYAMKGTDTELMLGAVIGKALENFDGGTGVIRVLVNVK